MRHTRDVGIYRHNKVHLVGPHQRVVLAPGEFHPGEADLARDTDDPERIRPLWYLSDRRGIRHDLAEMHSMVYAIDDAVGKILDAIAAAGLEAEPRHQHSVP